MRSAASIALKMFTVTVGLAFAVLAASAAPGGGPVVVWGAGIVPNIRATAIAAGYDLSCAIQAGTGCRG